MAIATIAGREGPSANRQECYLFWLAWAQHMAIQLFSTADANGVFRPVTIAAPCAAIQETIHDQPNRVRHVMNGFVIAVGSYVPALTDFALATGERIGPVSVDMGGTACKVPSAPEYIRKVQERGAIGKKRKTAKC